MKRLARLVARLYPRAWRTRYAREFDALLEDVDVGWRDVAGIVLGATTMHVRRRGLAVLGWAAAGALAGAAISTRVTPRYYSTSVIQLRLADAGARSTNGDRVAGLDALFASALSDGAMEALGRSEGFIGKDDSVKTAREAISKLRASTFVSILKDDGAAAGRTIGIGFIDTDRDRSQRVSRKLLTRLVAASTELPPWVVAGPLQILSAPTYPSASRQSQGVVVIVIAMLGLLMGIFAGRLTWLPRHFGR